MRGAVLVFFAKTASNNTNGVKVLIVLVLVNVGRVDFIVVMESIVSLALKAVKSTSSLNISALRGLRVLRPLRAVTYIQQVGKLHLLPPPLDILCGHVPNRVVASNSSVIILVGLGSSLSEGNCSTPVCVIFCRALFFSPSTCLVLLQCLTMHETSLRRLTAILRSEAPIG